MTGLDLLEEVYRDITVLGERFPGIPFMDVLSAPQPKRASVRQAMMAAGVRQDDIDLVLGAEPAAELRSAELSPYQVAEAFEMLRTGSKAADFQRMGYSQTQAYDFTAMRQPLTRLHHEILGHLAENPDDTISGIARACGTNRPTVRRALDKLAYREWLAMNHPDDYEKLANIEQIEAMAA